MKFKINKGLPTQAGFTLLELLVVIGISTVIMATLVFQQKQWGDNLAVRSQAYELALEIRQAQIYSLGVRVDKANSNADQFNVGYGVYLDTTNTRYIYFADRNNNQKYDSGEAIETKTFTNGVTIKDVCGKSACMFSGGSTLNQADITFFRPDTKANVSLLDAGGSSADVSPVTITLQSPAGNTSTVKVEANGQVSIN